MQISDKHVQTCISFCLRIRAQTSIALLQSTQEDSQDAAAIPLCFITPKHAVTPANAFPFPGLSCGEKTLLTHSEAHKAESLLSFHNRVHQ